jgi:rhodanese-related sulfurtransferase
MHELTELLARYGLQLNRGFTRVRPLEGGLEAWIEAGGPVDVFPFG